jgi:hypothetical protein
LSAALVGAMFPDAAAIAQSQTEMEKGRRTERLKGLFESYKVTTRPLSNDESQFTNHLLLNRRENLK